jgi:hypothetical protein
MKLKRAVILVSAWIFSFAITADAQSIAEESLRQSPSLTAVETAIKQKVESAMPTGDRTHPKSRLPSRAKASASWSHSRGRPNQGHRSERRRSARLSMPLWEAPEPFVIVPMQEAPFVVVPMQEAPFVVVPMRIVPLVIVPAPGW